MKSSLTARRTASLVPLLEDRNEEETTAGLFASSQKAAW